MALPPSATGDSFHRPPVSFVDDDDRRITIDVTDDATVDDLVSMYTDFAAKDRSQGLPPRTEGRTREWVTGLLDDGVNLLARHEERVVGHAVLLPFDEMAELAIFVHQAYQQAGIGSTLIRALLGEGEATGIDHIWLSVGRTNTVAVTLYRSVGFEKTVNGMELEMELELSDGERADAHGTV